MYNLIKEANINRLKAVWEQRKKVIIFCLIALLYSLGGGGWLVLRRYIMPLVIILTTLKLPDSLTYVANSYQFKNQGILKKALLVFVCLSFPLHIGYTCIVDPEKYLQISLLGLLYGLSWCVVLKRRVLLSAIVLSIIFPLAIVLDKRFGLPWQFCELLIGFGYSICYLMAVGLKQEQ